MIKTILVAASSVAALSAAAHAEPKFYAGINFGQTSFSDGELRGANASGAPRNIDIEFDSGQFIAGSLGFIAKENDYGRVRFDVEAAFHDGDVDQLILNDVERRVRDGSEISATTVMINAYYDTPKFAERFRGFAGAGFGVGNIDHEVRYLVERPEEAGGNLAIAIPSSETTLAYQFVLGAEAEITPHLSFIVDGRFVEFGDTQVERFVLTTGALDSVLDSDNGTTTVSFGLRARF
ncbi:MAG: outer membrane beta-barrel protein [Pseudomonadota bacterium]